MSKTPKSERTGKILLTNAFAPWGVDDEFTTRELKYEGVHTNFTRMQGIFSPRGFVTNPATHFIACNIDSPCVVLDSPGLESFKNELKNNYDYLGISFLTCEFPKVKKMIEIAKEVAPWTKIVIGGYGLKDGCFIIISGNVRDFISIKNLRDLLHSMLWRKISLKFKLINALNILLNLLKKRFAYGTQN